MESQSLNCQSYGSQDNLSSKVDQLASKNIERTEASMVLSKSELNKISPSPQKKGDGSSSKKSKTASERSAHCYKKTSSLIRDKCTDNFVWQNGKYQRDECGSGIVPPTFNFSKNRASWCQTPLSMYQATIGELGRRILCRLTNVPRDVRPAPPCNIEEFILPPCRGYYRKYECIKPCEEQHTHIIKGQKVYRDAVSRYWQPCLEDNMLSELNVNEFAHHNVVLGKKMRRVHGTAEMPCW